MTCDKFGNIPDMPKQFCVIGTECTFHQEDDFFQESPPEIFCGSKTEIMSFFIVSYSP
jgi:hypothetical protein